MACSTSTTAKEVNSKAYEQKASAAASRGAVHISQQAQQQVQITGKLHEFADPLSGPRSSRNSYEVDKTQAIWRFTLKYGVARYSSLAVDSTYSFEKEYEESFRQTGSYVGFTHVVHPDQNDQVNVMLFQDRDDDTYPDEKGRRLSYGRSVAVLATMIEADEDKILDQNKLLIPGMDGKDGIEEGQLVLAQWWWRTEAWSLRYGLLPYGFLISDQEGRNTVEAWLVRQQLGADIQSDIATVELGRELGKKMHTFFFNVHRDRPQVDAWWTRVLGKGHVIYNPNPRYTAAMQAAVVYWTENSDATESNTADFIMTATRGSNYSMGAPDAQRIVKCIVDANVERGAQPKVQYPAMGSEFDHPVNEWDINHPLYTPWQEQGLPDPKSEFVTQFTSIADAVVGSAHKKKSGVVNIQSSPTTPDNLADDDDIEWEQL